MPGYLLVEQSQLAPLKEDGLTPHAEPLGFLDLLRELAEDELPFPRFTELRAVGFEEVLFAARPEERAVALEIHHCLQRAASNLEQRLLSIQVVLQGTLHRGDTLWVNYRGVNLPVDLVFDTPLITHDARGNRFCRAHFNLTSPGA